MSKEKHPKLGETNVITDLAHTKEGINLPSSRQAFDSTINISQKASIKSDYTFAWNSAAKC